LKIYSVLDCFPDQHRGISLCTFASTTPKAPFKAYAVAAKSRLAAVPDVPTVDEAGLPGFYSSPWYAFWVPWGTPKPVVASTPGTLFRFSLNTFAQTCVGGQIFVLHQ
jgi:hypothetical protein